GGAQDGAGHVEAVVPAAVQREVRVVVADLRVARDGVRWDVRRVGDDDVDGAVELGQRRRGVVLDERDVRGDVGGVAAGDGEGRLAQLHGPDLGGRHLGGDGEGDRPRAGAQVDDARCGEPAGGGDRLLGDELGLRAHDERAGGGDQPEVTEEHLAGEVLERLAPAAALDERGVRGELVDRKSTRLNSSHVKISYAVFCLKKKNYTFTTLMLQLFK